MTAPAAVSAPERGAPCGVAGAAAAVFARTAACRPCPGGRMARAGRIRPAADPLFFCFLLSPFPFSRTIKK